MSPKTLALAFFRTLFTQNLIKLCAYYLLWHPVMSPYLNQIWHPLMSRLHLHGIGKMCTVFSMYSCPVRFKNYVWFHINIVTKLCIVYTFCGLCIHGSIWCISILWKTCVFMEVYGAFLYFEKLRLALFQRLLSIWRLLRDIKVTENFKWHFLIQQCITHLWAGHFYASFSDPNCIFGCCSWWKVFIQLC